MSVQRPGLIRKRRPMPRGVKVRWSWTAASPEQAPTFRAILAEIAPKQILEIGTFQGVSTSLLAEFAPVQTFDCLKNKDRQRLWGAMGVAHRITSYVGNTRGALDRMIRGAAVTADLAFVDGSHLLPDVVHDFDLVRGVPVVVLHDYWLEGSDRWPDVRTFVDGLPRSEWEVEIRNPFAIVKPR